MFFAVSRKAIRTSLEENGGRDRGRTGGLRIDNPLL
jgi:hypothetical protein